jgi:hypothetical protein
MAGPMDLGSLFEQAARHEDHLRVEVVERTGA